MLTLLHLLVTHIFGKYHDSRPLLLRFYEVHDYVFNVKIGFVNIHQN